MLINMKLGTIIAGRFLLMACIAALIGLTGIVNLREVSVSCAFLLGRLAAELKKLVS